MVKEELQVSAELGGGLADSRGSCQLGKALQ